MKKTLFTLVACLATCVSLHGWESNEGFYVGGLLGPNWQVFKPEGGSHVDMKTGAAADIFAGYKFCNQFRVEGDIAYRYNSIEQVKFLGEKLPFKGHMESFSFLANALYDFDFGCGWTPYAGLGIGYSKMTSHVTVKDIPGVKFEDRDDGFAWQAIAGVSYPIACKTDVGLEYRYLYAKKHTQNHSAVVSLKRYF